MARKFLSAWVAWTIVLSLASGLFAPATATMDVKAAPLAPDSVTLVGSLQDELGCPGDWQPECANTHMTYDANDDVWQASWEVPTGDFEYKVALNDSWDENYGANAQPSGANIPLSLSAATTVTFFYDDKSHWVADDQNSIMATVPGDFQTELGCASDWDPSCLRSWLQDPDGDGIYSFQTDVLPVGDYQGKVAIDQSWDENYGVGGAPGGGNYQFSVTQLGVPVTFSYDPTTHLLSIQVGSGPELDDDVIWADGLAHDSRSDFYRQPFGAVTTGTDIVVRFRTYANDVSNVRMRVWDTTAGKQAYHALKKVTTMPGKTFDYDIWDVKFTAPMTPTVLYYRFVASDGSAMVYYEDHDLYDGGLGMALDESADRSWQIDVYADDFEVPDWFKDAVVYQIFPDRFRNGLATNDPVSGTFFYEEHTTVNAPRWNWIVPDPRASGEFEGIYSQLFYGGDLQGIIDKLDYIQEMGINTLYLNPIFEAPSNHKYDATTYETIDDNFGTLETFKTLAEELDNRDMHLVLDGVFNHTASDSHYFDRYGRYDDYLGACEAITSPYRSWYYFSPASPAGTGECAGDTTYEAWWGFKSLPKLNTTDEEAVRTYIYSGTTAFGDTSAIARYWLEQGADGWRLDVAGDVAHSFWKDWRDDIRDAKADAITIAEEWGDASRFLLGDELDSTMNYRFRNAVIGVLRETDWTDTNSTIKALSVSQFDSVMHSIEEDYPPEAFYAMMNLVGSHDVNRVLIPLDQDGDPTDADYSDGKMRQKMLALIQMTMPGAPTVYYGDEISLVGYGEANANNAGGVYYSDPYNRQPYPWDDAAGYDALPAWRKGDLTMREHYSATAAIRNANAALRTGSFDTLLVDDTADVYAYGRRLGADVAVVGLNFGTAQTMTIPMADYLPDGTKLTDALNGGSYTVNDGEIVVADVASMWGCILIVDAGQDLTATAAPTNLAATEGDGEVGLAWDAVTDAASYNVYRSYVSGGGYEIISHTTSLTFNDTTVANGTLYYYVVTALDAVGNESVVSNEVSALPHYTIAWANLQWPYEITHTIGITPTEKIYGQVYIDGVTPNPGATEGLLAQVGYGTGTDAAAWTTWVNATFNTDAWNANDEFAAQLLPEEVGEFNYAYRYSTTGGRDWVYAHRNGTVGVPVFGKLHVQASDDTTAPATPLNLRVVHWGPDHITVQWDAVSDADLAGYDVYRYGEGETSADALRVGRIMGQATVYTDTDVMMDMTYTYTVRSFDQALNKSAASNAVSGTAEARMVEVRFRVQVPPFTPDGATIYIAGDNDTIFGASWNPGKQPITQLGPTMWGYTTTIKEGTALQYKYTRGSWDVVENWGTLVGEANRHLTVNYAADGLTVQDVVYNWRDPLVVQHYPAMSATTWITNTAVWALVSRPVNPSLVTTETFQVTSEGEAVDGTVSTKITTFDPEPDTSIIPAITGTLVTFSPTMALDTENFYHVLMVAKGYHEEVDMQANYTWAFGTQSTQSLIYLPLVLRRPE